MAQIIFNQSLVPLSKLNSDFNIPQSYFFRFLQLSHAFSHQFSNSPPQLVQSSLEDLLRSDCAKKPTSQLYSHLTVTSLPTMEKLRSKWSHDIPNFDNDDWDDIWDFPFSSLVSLRDRLIQFKIVHRAYFTPHRLHKMNPTPLPGVGDVVGLLGTSPTSSGPVQQLSDTGGRYWTLSHKSPLCHYNHQCQSAY